jgi:hypothetical protein
VFCDWLRHILPYTFKSSKVKVSFLPTIPVLINTAFNLCYFEFSAVVEKRLPVLSINIGVRGQSKNYVKPTRPGMSCGHLCYVSTGSF